jgi:hypothetical protein
MRPSPEQIARVCAIAHDKSGRGGNKSLSEVVADSGYLDLRANLTDAILADYLEEHPEVVKQWALYSGNKRTNGGWYFLCDPDAWIVGRLGPDMRRTDESQYPSAGDACACFILAELDSWVSLGGS